MKSKATAQLDELVNLVGPGALKDATAHLTWHLTFVGAVRLRAYQQALQETGLKSDMELAVLLRGALPTDAAFFAIPRKQSQIRDYAKTTMALTLPQLTQCFYDLANVEDEIVAPNIWHSLPTAVQEGACPPARRTPLLTMHHVHQEASVTEMATWRATATSAAETFELPEALRLYALCWAAIWPKDDARIADVLVPQSWATTYRVLSELHPPHQFVLPIVGAQAAKPKKKRRTAAPTAAKKVEESCRTGAHCPHVEDGEPCCRCGATVSSAELTEQ